jgi:hypothetical protein
MISVKNGASIVQGNLFNQLYCDNACILVLTNSNAVVQNNMISNIAGQGIVLDSSQLVLQD